RVLGTSDDAGERQLAVLRRAAAGAGRGRGRHLQRAVGTGLAGGVAAAPLYLGGLVGGRGPEKAGPPPCAVDELHRHAAVWTGHRLVLCWVRVVGRAHGHVLGTVSRRGLEPAWNRWCRR